MRGYAKEKTKTKLEESERGVNLLYVPSVFITETNPLSMGPGLRGFVYHTRSSGSSVFSGSEQRAHLLLYVAFPKSSIFFPRRREEGLYKAAYKAKNTFLVFFFVRLLSWNFFFGRMSGQLNISYKLDTLREAVVSFGRICIEVLCSVNGIKFFPLCVLPSPRPLSFQSTSSLPAVRLAAHESKSIRVTPQT